MSSSILKACDFCGLESLPVRGSPLFPGLTSSHSSPRTPSAPRAQVHRCILVHLRGFKIFVSQFIRQTGCADVSPALLMQFRGKQRAPAGALIKL